MRFKPLFAILVFMMALPAFAQVKTIKTPTLTTPKPKILVTGHAQYYGNAQYISASLTLKLDGRPLTNVKVRINDSELHHAGGGTYNGSIPSVYTIRLGNELVFSVEFPKGPFPIGSPPPFTGKVELGTYRISNIINWDTPKPGDSVSIAKTIGLTFRWKFTGTPARTQFFLKDNATNTEIFSVYTSAEHQSVRTALFTPGKEYVMGLWAADPIDAFKLTSDCAAGSKIDWYFSNTMTFRIAKSSVPTCLALGIR